MKLLKIIGMFILALLIMSITQGIASIFSDLIPFLGIGAILQGLLYVIFAFLVVRLFIMRVFKDNLTAYRITKPKFNIIYVVLGIGLPVAVYAVYFIFVPGDFIVHHFSTLNDTLHMFFWSIFVTAIGGAIVEEMVCRGFLMGYVEKKTNINVAIISTAIFFGAIHLLNGGLNVTSFFLLLISGSLVGIMFGLATYTFNTIWASITLHFCWNLSQIVFITEKESQYSLWQYVLHTNNIAITGNQFGYEASVISIAGYICMILILLTIKRKQA
ncbi:type II CAAX endopeptidase family protein [Staphylococcus borealis]|uniref:CPBP family intramembrane glutamic endopeptidase n=1 Tax=Staphylococcus borealis TaxID=2742203 RepID=UPI0025A00A3A|nr:type II CAAX endopeptidase family protein [Staphylococcus borealis]MDM7881270.1 type II CAAX endopeptidase family protein [Staphylococcus borealis]